MSAWICTCRLTACTCKPWEFAAGLSIGLPPRPQVSAPERMGDDRVKAIDAFLKEQE